MFVRSELFQKFGGFDNNFFAHMEEIDFCWRLKNEGYKIMYCSSSSIFHIGGGTLPKNNPQKTYLNFRNNFFLLYKNLPSKRLFPVFFIRLFLDGIAGMKFLFEGDLKDVIAVTRAHFSFYSSLRRLNRERKKIKHSQVSCVYKRSIVFDHYLNKKKSFLQLDKQYFTK